MRRRRRVGGEATEPEVGFGVDFDDDPELPPGALVSDAPSTDVAAAEACASEDEDWGAGAAEDERPGSDPPWCPPGTSERLRRLESPLVRLHAEIVDFCRFLEPTAEEAAARAAAVERVRAVVMGIWPEARFEVHGSFATGMYLPSSDIDAVILDSGCKSPATCLKALATCLSRKGMATKIQLIAKARVPIVKFEERPSGFQFDISFDVANGPASAEIVRANMRRFPALRPLTTVLKAFLQQRALNEVYTGGIGSYALLCMVMAHLQLHDASATASAWAGESGGDAAAEGCLGVLLIDFFELYGRRINTDDVGVSCRGGGRFFAKRDKEWTDAGRPFLLAIEDPQDPTNDLGRNSYAARQIKSAFEHAFTVLTAPVVNREDFLLRRIVRMDPKTLRARKPPERPGAIAGVAADFERYARAAADEDGDGGGVVVGGGGQKRKAAATPAKRTASSSSSSESETDDGDDNEEMDVEDDEEMDVEDDASASESGSASESDSDSDSDSDSHSDSESSSDGSEEEGQVAKRRKTSGGRGGGGRGGRGGRVGRGGRGGRGGRAGRGRGGGKPSGRGGHKTPAGKKRRKGDGGGGASGYFSKGRPGARR